MKTLQQLTEKEFNDLAGIGMLWEFYPEAPSRHELCEEKKYSQPISPLNCPCCGSNNFRTENLVLEGLIACRNCKLTMVRKHSNKDIDNGLYLAIEAWNKRVKEVAIDNPKLPGKLFLYGGENTIHRTKLLNIEVDRWTGKVVSVWFRCLHLPFDITSVDKNRSKEMKRLYEENEPVKIDAIEVEK